MTCKRAHHSHVLIFFVFIAEIVTLLVSLGAPHAMASTPLFLPAVTYNTGAINALFVAVADVNSDGKLDLLVANECTSGINCANGGVGVLLGNGDGTFQPVATYASGGLQASMVAVADVNGDGKLDLLVTNSYFSNSVGVLLGNGDGTFQPVVTYSSGGGFPWSLAVADVNGDGKPDLLVANSSSCYGCADGGLVGVLLGIGDGTFQSAVTYSSGGFADVFGPLSIAVADMNGDGRPDLLVTNACGDFDCSKSGSVGLLLGNGDGTFQSVVTFDSGFLPGGAGLAVSDVNGDGRPDLIVGSGCTYTGNCPKGVVSVLLGNGNGTFQSPVSYDTGGWGAAGMTVADVNGDAKPDLLVTDYCAASNGNCGFGAAGVVGVLLGNGDGTFQPVVTYDSGGFWIADSVAVGDVNGDGKPDLLVVNLLGTNGGDGSVGVLLNNTPFDTTPPIITLSVAPKVLRPPKGKMAPVTISGTITDTGSGVNLGSPAYSVTDEYGQVQPAGAITLGAGGSYSFTVWLQASRLGSDLDGRQYTITVQAKDNAGNAASQASVVTVPHDRGN